MVTDRQRGVLIGLFAGLGTAFLLGGLFSAGAMFAIPVQVGLADRWGTEAFNDPVFYLFAAFALCFMLVAGVGAYLCYRAYRLYRSRGAKAPK
ncbi:MAG: hypothetical protein RJB12_237 [Pseudomonadota bacterium]